MKKRILIVFSIFFILTITTTFFSYWNQPPEFEWNKQASVRTRQHTELKENQLAFPTLRAFSKQAKTRENKSAEIPSVKPKAARLTQNSPSLKEAPSYKSTSAAFSGYQVASRSTGPKEQAPVDFTNKSSAKAAISFLAGSAPIAHLSLKFLNEQVIEHNFSFKNSIVGGLSALAYDSKTNTFLALSDDKGRKGPPRLYKLKLNKEDKRYRLQLTDLLYLKDQAGRSFLPIDPEGISILDANKMLISSEGAQIPGLKVPPAIFTFDSKGNWLNTWPIPDMFWPEDLAQLGKWGVKENKAFEALAISPNKNKVWVATESPLHQDEQDQTENKQYIRISEFDAATSDMQAQFIYPMQARIEQGNLKGNNGLTDFISLGSKKLLTLERSYLKNETRFGNRKTDANFVRLFLADCSEASDVSAYNKLEQGRITTCGKTLVADLSYLLGNRLDNLEGIVMGPVEEKGKHLIVLVSDNNFSDNQRTQFLFFEYSPE